MTDMDTVGPDREMLRIIAMCVEILVGDKSQRSIAVAQEVALALVRPMFTVAWQAEDKSAEDVPMWVCRNLACSDAIVRAEKQPWCPTCLREMTTVDGPVSAARTRGTA